MIRTGILLLASALAPLLQGPAVPAEHWTAPTYADALKDPLAADPKAVEKGARVFSALCWTCHGMTGAGDGPNAAALKKRPADLRSPLTHAQSNGALFWKVTNGRGEMASYELVLSREERWAVVHYLRTLSIP